MQSGSDFILNGVLSSKAHCVTKVLDQDRWSQAEARTTQLLEHIQPNPITEARRNAVVSYLRLLIMKRTPCQVFAFGSVPLKTYLPDGDIDLTAFCDDQQSEERLIHDVLQVLQREEKKNNAEFDVKEVKYVRAEVKIIKCLVESYIVDISFNQISGLGTLCFLEEVDYMIQQDHLFKRSVILIKAWCYYESRILGSHHGLISTYALETLVIYVFHVYSKTFAGPLEVLLRFLDLFSGFDWTNYCISLRGPVRISSLPNMRAEPPRKNCQELLLREQFLYGCESCYGVMPSSQELREKPFASKFLNIVDPLRSNNNLGRSINKGNFCRIKSAIAFGAKQIERLLDCPKDKIIAEFDLFFKNTWDRNGNGYWMDTHSYDLCLKNNNVTGHESEVELTQASHGIYQIPANHLEESKMFGTSDVSAASQTWSSTNNSIFTGAMTSGIEHTNTTNNAIANRAQSPMYSSNEVQDMLHFQGYYTGSEFSHLYSEAPTHHYYNTGISPENQQSFGQISFDWVNGYAYDLENTSSNYYHEYGYVVNEQNVFPVDEGMLMHQEEHNYPNFNGYLQAPVNVNSSDVASFPQPPPPHVLTSGYGHENSLEVFPEDVHSFESFPSHNMPYSHGTAPFPSEWFPLYEEEQAEPVNHNVLIPCSDQQRQMAVNIGSRSGNSSLHSGARSYTPKNHGVTTQQKWVVREKGSSSPPDNKIINKDVNTGASSGSKSSLLPTPGTSLPSSNVSSEPSSETPQPDGVSGNCIGQSTIGTDLCEITSTEAVTSHVHNLQLSRKLPMIVSNSSFPEKSPVYAGPFVSSQRAVDSQSLLPVADGSSGPFQVPNMFSYYNLPTETGTTFAATNDGHMDAELGYFYPHESSIVGLDSTQHAYHTSYDASGYFVKEGSDILDGDFPSYWVNLQYARIYKNPQLLESLPPPSTTQQMHLRGQLSRNKKSTDVMNNTGHVQTPVPVMPPRRASPLHGSTNERGSFWIPRFSDGTGTYLPNTSNYFQVS
uniref:Poly(A) RNA polymerase cid14 n=1 Tax=Cajanus cajan TaxID=3821 RepID=A0A151TSC4_CAJCA|nr:Poly(A) RNA polymerase cid14 [Cajanus cajan]